MKKALLSISSWVVYIGFFSFIGAVIGLSIGNKLYDYNLSGARTSWELLGGNLKFEHIVAADENARTIWAQTADGTLFFWKSGCSSPLKCNQWVETKDVPSNINEYGGFTINEGNICPKDQRASRVTKSLPGEIVECVYVWFQSIVGIDSNYALLKDGTIWYWHPPVASDTISSTVLVSTLIGIVVGAIVGIIFLKRFS